MDDEKRRLRDEVADLAGAVRDLRAQLAQRDPGHCCHGHCLHWHYTPAPYYPQPVIYAPYTVTCGNVSGGDAGGGTLTYSSAAGGSSTALGAINYS